MASNLEIQNGDIYVQRALTTTYYTIGLPNGEAVEVEVQGNELKGARRLMSPCIVESWSLSKYGEVELLREGREDLA